MNAVTPRSDPHQFVGGLVGGALMKKAVEYGVKTAVRRVVKSPSLPVEQKHSAPIEEVVTKEVLKEVGPVLENLTNQEPLWRSKVLWTAIGTFCMSAANVIDMARNGAPDTATNYYLAIAAMVGSVGTIYARLRPSKALGR